MPLCSLSKSSTNSWQKAQEEPPKKLKGQQLIEKETVETGKVRRMDGGSIVLPWLSAIRF